MGSENLLVADITQVDTGAMYPLGTIFEEPAGYGSKRDPAVAASRKDRGIRKWIYAYNDSGSTTARGTVISRKAATTTLNVKACPTSGISSSNIVGVGDHDIVTGSYGWYIREGWCEVIADTGGITVDQPIVPGNAVAGTADTNSTVTAGGFGYASETVLATALATCYVSCQG